LEIAAADSAVEMGGMSYHGAVVVGSTILFQKSEFGSGVEGICFTFASFFSFLFFFLLLLLGKDEDEDSL